MVNGGGGGGGGGGVVCLFETFGQLVGEGGVRI